MWLWLDSRHQSLVRLQRDNSKATCPAFADQQASDYLPSEHRTSMSFADRYESLHSQLTQHTGNPAQSSSLPAESSLLLSEPTNADRVENSQSHPSRNGPFQGCDSRCACIMPVLRSGVTVSRHKDSRGDIPTMWILQCWLTWIKGNQCFIEMCCWKNC
jgi:hypothetical protein